MTKEAFVKELRAYLEETLPGKEIEETLAFYSDYIDRQTKQGRTEEEAVAELGDPALIGKSIAEADHHRESGQGRGGSADQTYAEQAEGAAGFRKSGERIFLEIVGAVVGCIVFLVILRIVFFFMGPLLLLLVLAGAAAMIAQAWKRK